VVKEKARFLAKSGLSSANNGFRFSALVLTIDMSRDKKPFHFNSLRLPKMRPRQ
jgi:hypothetical protein